MASLVMPNRDPRDGFFYPTLTLMLDSYNVFQIGVKGNPKGTNKGLDCDVIVAEVSYRAS